MSLRAMIPASLAVLLAACAPPQSLQPSSGGPAIAGDGNCKAENVAWATGQEATQDTMARIWRESGAGLIRPIAPGQAVPRDFRPDRINVRIDGDNVITGVDCG